jgi:cytochrome c peroxidase
MARASWRWATAMACAALVIIMAPVASAARQPRCFPGHDSQLKVGVGQNLYFDTDLSKPNGQSCASCHWPATGYTDPDQDLPVSAGVIPGLFGGRSSPTSAYATFSPPFGATTDENGETLYVGGQFWDGRAKDLTAQAQGPFLNPVEMNNPSKWSVVKDVRDSRYAWAFMRVYGWDSFKPRNVDRTYKNIADAIAAFESSSKVNTFSSRYDAWVAGRPSLGAEERLGLQLFNDPLKGNCDACHPSGTGPTAVAGKPVFTDFTYDNLGLPTNQAFFAPPLSFVGYAADLGLAKTTGDAAHNGMFKVPTLRNVAKSAPYGHNGYFATLKDIVHFYNTRDVAGEGPGGADWPDAEVPGTVNMDELGNLGLTGAEEDAIVAFLRTLNDRQTICMH